MKKDQIIAHWNTIDQNQPIAIKPIPYKNKGTTYDMDGIRITGSQKFIDSVLSRLKDLLDYEADETRLQIAYNESTDRETRAKLGSYNCYIQVHYRGDEARRINRYISRCRARKAAAA